MIYEQGKAPEGAPVTWCERDPGSDFIIEFDQAGTTRGFAATFHTQANASSVADAICRAFHLAALAEEARGSMDRGYSALQWDSSTLEDWCRRFDAAKGGA